MKNWMMQLKKYTQELEQVINELSGLPEGSLIKKKSYYYHTVRDKQIGITRNPTLIRQLARKKYLLARRAQLDHNLNVKSPEELDIRTSQQLIANLPAAYQTLPLDYFYHPSVPAWLAKQPRKNTLYRENEKYIYNGTAYRTMSERQIAEILHQNNLLYQYDCTFDMGVALISPDFVIKNPFNNTTVLCEFFGAFHKASYGEAMNDKLDNYAKVGYIEGNNLITLFEYHLRDPQRIQTILESTVL